MSHIPFQESSLKKNQYKTINTNISNSNHSKYNDSVSTEQTLFDSRVVSQQNSPKSILRNKDKVKSLTPTHNTFSINQTLQQLGSQCLEHKKQKLYICVTCNVRLCPDCTIFGSKHQKHQFRRYDNQLKNYNMKIEKFLIYLSQQKNLLNKKKNKFVIMEEANERYQDEKLQMVEKNISQMMEKYKNNLNKIKIKQEQFLKQKNKLQNFQETYNKSIKNLKEQSKMQLINQKNLQKEIMQGINQIDQMKQQNFGISYQNNICKPKFQQFQVNISNFSQVSQQKQQIIEQFNCLGIKWKIKVYPNGYITPSSHTIMRQTKYLSVYIQMLESPHTKNNLSFQVILINQKNGCNLQKQFKSQFSIGQSWGYDRFTRVHNLHRKGFISENGNIVLKICMSWSTYNEGIVKLNKLIKNRQIQMQENKQRIKKLKLKLTQQQTEKEKKILKPKLIKYVSLKNLQLIRQNKNNILSPQKILKNF